MALLPASSNTVTVAPAVLASAVSGVPPIAPVPESMLGPDGSPVARYSPMPPPPMGLTGVIASLAFNFTGPAYVGAVGVVSAIVRVRLTLSGAVNPVLAADTVTSTLVLVMYKASASTLTDQVAVPPLSAEVAVSVSVPISTVTPTPLSRSFRTEQGESVGGALLLARGCG